MIQDTELLIAIAEITVIFAVIMGIIVGYITSQLRKEAPKDDNDEFCQAE